MIMLFKVILISMLLVSITSAKENEAKDLCDAEIKKEIINKEIIQQQCIKAAKFYEENKEFFNASWYYLLGGNNDKNINDIESKIPNKSNFLNLAHSYVLEGDYEKAKELYLQFLKNNSIPWADDATLDDYKLLKKLYPNKQTELQKGLAIWNEAYKPLLPVKQLYTEYKQARKEKRYTDAIKNIKEVITLQEKYQNKDNIDIWDNYYSLGVVYNYNEEYKKSLEIFKQVEQRYKDNKEREKSYADLLGWIADSYKYLQDYPQAIEYYKKSLAITEKVLGLENLEIAKSYDRIATIYAYMQEHNRALKYFRKSLQIQLKLKKEPDLRMANSYKKVGEEYFGLYENDNAIVYFKKALKIRLEMKDKSYTTVDIYRRIGITYYMKADFKNALEFYNTLLNNPLFEQKYLNYIYSDIGFVYETLQDYQKSIKYYTMAIDSCEKDDSKTLQDYYEKLAMQYSSIGLYSKSEYFYRKSLEQLEKYENKDWKYYESVGDLYSKLHDVEKSTIYYKKAITFVEKLSEVNQNHFMYLKKLAELYDKLHNREKSVEYYINSYKALKKINKKDSMESINILRTVADKYSKGNLKSRKLSIKYYLKVINYFQNRFGLKHLALSNLYDSLADIYKKNKNYYEAERYYWKTINTIEKYHHMYTFNKLVTYEKLADTYFIDKKPNKAFDYSMLAFDLVLNIKNDIFYTLSSVEKKEFIEKIDLTVATCFETAGEAFKDKKFAYQYCFNDVPKWLQGSFIDDDSNKTIDEQKTEWDSDAFKTEKEIKYKNISKFFSHWLNYKGSILDSENSIATLYEQTKDQKIKEKIEELRDKKMFLAKLDQQYPTAEQAKAHQENIKQTKDKIDELERDLSSKVESFKEEMNLRVLTLDNVAQYLKPNELYIDYAKAEDNYYLFTLNNKKEVTFTQIDTNDTKTIEEGIQEFRDQTKYMSTNLSILKDKEIQELKISSIANLSKLYNLLIDKPIAKTIKDYSSLIISPDGALSLLPFESLYNPSTKKYIIQEKAIRYVPSGKEFVRLNRRTELSNKDVVVFANPNFEMELPSDVKSVDIKRLITPNTQSRGIELEWSYITQLKGSKEEANFIKDKYKKQALMFTEEAARESNLLKVKEPKILHLSTHGYFLNDENITNPMLKSGLLFSGAQTTFKHEKDGGVISALRLSGLNLKGTELVMLSACETGVSDISNGGEGVSGLNKAFLQAGASDVAMTLWSVADKETADLIKEFYENIDDKNYNEALREAKLKFIENEDNVRESHPYYWAGFIVSGK